MPFLLSGELTLTAIQDLGGMGVNESVPVVCRVNWTPPILETIPWLLLAGVLWIERHRRRGNRWIVLALAAGCIAQWALARCISFVPDSAMDIFKPVFQALVFGNAFMWLASARLANPKRGATFLGMLAAAVIAGAAMLGASIDIFDISTAAPSAIFLLILISISLASYKTASRYCKNAPTMARFILLFALVFLAIDSGIIGVFSMLEGGNISWLYCLAMSACLTTAAFIGLLPIILALFLHPAQRSRLQDLLHLSAPGPSDIKTL